MAPRRKGKKRATVPKAVRAYVKSQQTRQLETKYYNIFDQTLSPDWSGTLFDLTGNIATGTTVATRVGDAVTLREIDWRGIITSADTHNFVRVALFQWRADTSVDTPTAGSVLETVNDVLAPVTLWNWDRRAEYKVLWDKTYYLDSADDTAVQFSGKIGPRKLKTPIHYNPGYNTGMNHVFLMVISDSSAISHPQVNWDMRLKYKDA